MEERKKKMLLFGVVAGTVLLALIVVLVLLLAQSCSHDRTPPLSDTPGADRSEVSMPEDSSLSESDVPALPADGTATGTASGNAQGSTTAKTSGSSSTGTTRSASGGEQSSSPSNITTTKKDSAVNNTIDTSRYNLYTYTQRYWEGDTVYNESVYPMTTQSGENEVIQLLYPATKILEVRSSDLKTVYEEGKDYQLSGGKLVIPKGSRIPVNDYNRYYLTESIADHAVKRLGGGYMYFSEGPTFHNAQIAVTYQHSAKWTGPVPAKQGAKLPRLSQRIAEKGSINIVFFGDSISCGANASSTVGASPMTPKWSEMFVEALEEQGVAVTDYNTAVGGQVSSYGVTNVQAKVIRYAPELVVLGFGMNDASLWNNTSVQQYYDNIRATIIQIREKLPECEIILLGSIIPNPEAVEFVGNGFIPQYTEQLKKLAGEYSGVVVADMTEIHTHILTRKNYRDITGNNVNHPNDFIARMYTQVLLDTISR